MTWEEQRVAWYGRILKTVRLATGVSLWYKSGEKPLKIRWVLVYDPATKKAEAFFCTDIMLSPVTVVEYFVLRWNLEVTFEEARAHLGDRDTAPVVRSSNQQNNTGTIWNILAGLFNRPCAK